MRRRIASATPITAAENDTLENTLDNLQDVSEVSEAVNKAADAVEDMQEAIDDANDVPADTILETENNIENHYIAECKRCHEIFISAVVESDSNVESIEGECPCCHEDTTQDLKWIIRNKSFGNEA